MLKFKKKLLKNFMGFKILGERQFETDRIHFLSFENLFFNLIFVTMFCVVSYNFFQINGYSKIKIIERFYELNFFKFVIEEEYKKWIRKHKNTIEGKMFFNH